MSGDTTLTIIAVSLTAIFIFVFAIECDRVWQRYRASRRREMEEGAWFSRPLARLHHLHHPGIDPETLDFKLNDSGSEGVEARGTYGNCRALPA
jgi:hypothetical protein